MSMPASTSSSPKGCSTPPRSAVSAARSRHRSSTTVPASRPISRSTSCADSASPSSPMPTARCARRHARCGITCTNSRRRTPRSSAASRRSSRTTRSAISTPSSAFPLSASSRKSSCRAKRCCVNTRARSASSPDAEKAMHNSRRTARFRELIRDGKLHVRPSAFDALSAKILERSGFEVIGISGYCVSVSIGEAVRRARAYLDAGADMIFPEGLLTADEIGRFVAAIDAPINYNRTGVSPMLDLDELRGLGVRFVSNAGGAFRAATRAVWDYFQAMKAEDPAEAPPSDPADGHSLADLDGFLGLRQIEQLNRELYAGMGHPSTS